MPADVTKYQEALKKASATIERLLGENERLKAREPVAIIGMGCRLPGGANSPEEYWRLLAEGRDAISAIPAERWPAARYFDENAEAIGKMYIRAGGFLDHSPYDFDPRFFGISPKEAKALDPQQRLLLETTWEALEDAGIAPAALAGSRTGVFVGISSNDYDSAHLRSGDPALIDPYSLTGFTFSTAVGRLSYTLGLEGPSFPVDTACSSSLVALHLACRSLRAGECDLALVGGVNLILTPEPLIAFCKLRALSPDGRCKTFDASADGYGRGEGCGMLVLKRLDAAQRDGDRLLALVKGSALNNDGRSNGLTAPNGLAQRRVISAALADAALQPGDIDYLEAHGTGTPLGDPIEIEAIAAALGQGPERTQPLLVGSAKTNIGHLEAAAGMAGIIKLVLALNRERIPRHLHFSAPNPHVAWDRLPLRVVADGAPWPRTKRPRRAGISGFGFSGTNAHVILEEAPQPAATQLADGRNSHLLVLSATDESALRLLAGRFAECLAAAAPPPLAAVCHTAASGRNRFPHGLAVAGATPAELVPRLAAFAAAGTTTGVHRRFPRDADPAGPVFLFTGQGSQYPGMGRELYDTSPVYRAALDRCDSLFAPLLGRSIRDLMHDGSEEELARTCHTQPAIFSLEYALAHLWQSWGVRPSAVLGHSIGEFVAAQIAGVLSLTDAVTLVAHRGRLMDALPAGGVMAAVLCPEAQVLSILAPYARQVAVAAVNAPEAVVISGEKTAVAATLEALRQQGVASQYLTVSHAFHSHLMDPALAPFEQVAAGMTFQAPTLPVIANVTGRPADGDDLQNAAYWRRQLRGTVRFSDSIACLQQQGHALFLEIGANPTLAALVRRMPGDARCATSLKRGASPWATLTTGLGELYAAGVVIDWQGYDAPYRAGKVALPTYPFQRERHFMNPVRQPDGRGDGLGVGETHPLLGRQLDSPSPERRFAGALGSATDAWLSGHAIYGATILPAAAYLEMALAAVAREGTAAAPSSLEQIRILAPLVLTAEARPLQTIHRPDTGEVEVFSRAGDRQWEIHARMTIRSEPRRTFAFPTDLPVAAAGSGRSGESFYADLLAKGYRYDGVFRSIRRLILQGSDVSGEVAVPATAARPFVLHPALLDGCLTLAGASFLYGAEPLPEGLVFVPAAIDSLLFSGRPVAALTVHCRQRERTPVSAIFDLFATDADGQPVLQISGLSLRRIRQNQLLPQNAPSIADLLYRLAWREASPSRPAAVPSGEWLVLTDSSPISSPISGAICDALRAAGVGVLEIAPAAAAPPEVQDRVAPLGGILSLRGSVDDNLQLVRGLLAAQPSPPLFLLTSGAHDPLGMERELRPEGAALWGFGASVAAEAPELACRLLDLSPWPGDDELALLLRELASADGEDRVALRGGRRCVPRLTAAPTPTLSDRLRLPEADGFYLDVEPRGSLDGLCLRTPGRRPPGSGQLEVLVRAVGLNFRDVLNVLGEYPGDPGLPGFECSGVIVGVGPDVDGFAVDQRVFVFNTDGCIADYLTVATANVIKMPALWSFEQSAAIPVAFLTAWYGLHQLAGIAPGDRVLIHAAAGGVGLAAVQLCLAAGAEVFATAGSPEKRDLLQRMGVRQVLDSRSLAFADQIGKGGLDIVLNSLAGEFIDRSIGLLTAGGRFIEIGKADSRSEEAIGAAYPHIVYHRFDLAALTAKNPDLTATLFSALFELFAAGRLSPLPMTVFPVRRVQDAFRFMAQARHVGKVVISLADRLRERIFASRGLIDPAATYLVTGGLGALGLAVAGWLAEQGCRSLVLVGRRGPAEAAAETLAALRRSGAQVTVRSCDVSDPDAFALMMVELRDVLPPLRGVFHAAGLLDDAMLPDLTDSQLERVLRPKIDGAWNLHRATAGDDLELFVLFSSLTAVTGSPGQANYAAANAALDGFARWRRSQGLAAVAIGWGPWEEAGMAAQAGRSERLAARGIRSLATATALQALAAVLRANPIEQCVADLDLGRLAAFVPSNGSGLYGELFSGALPNTAVAPAAGHLERLRQAVPAERSELMLLLVRELAAQVMGQSDPARIESDRPLQEQGFDSLMAVDLRNLMAKTFQLELPVSLLFDYPTPAKMGRFLLEQVQAGEDTAEPAPAAVDSGLSADELVAEIEKLLG